ncbi:Thiol-disulfide oxidoreductase ResA [Anatilimnocola aggregata]|uniref:Thiol-disulfide oxidoreductase ResA n=1 Tax=Anatilimnocola aggregata TaxID=2528021 RepID=A0A517YL08_9BACT|nr:TlpA disulfide reductase family protein [Anatilimnocola aggregata]QDU30911.1 Thiol-disulfide oxidoreductase ResA [Anatilimnocola aggregata]
MLRTLCLYTAGLCAEGYWKHLSRWTFLAGLAAPACFATPIWADSPSAADALRLVPVQPGINFDTPEKQDLARCKVDVETFGGITGWVVRDAGGQLLRRFLDTNGDNKVDQWCYFANGIEIYRDIDANYNNKADQYRWLGTAGIRWGTDENEDGRIDAWKSISPEEVTEELVAALRDGDAARFQRLLLTAEELQTLGLGADKVTEIKAKITDAAEKFGDVARKQTMVGKSAEWISFGASKPGVFTAGSEGSTKDLIIYDNVTAIVQNGKDKTSQLIVGSLVRVGDRWRLIDLPKNLLSDPNASTVAGYFFQAEPSTRSGGDDNPENRSVSPEVQKQIADLANVDKALAEATPAQLGKLNSARCDVLDQLVRSTTGEDRIIWVRQYAETVAAAVQSGAFPEGVRRLNSLLDTIKNDPKSRDLVPFVEFRQMSAEYNLSLQAKEPDFEKINTSWMNNLEAFISQYATSPDAAEAMLQLAIGYEFSGKEEKALEWFGRIVKEFGSTELAKKAAGAKRRLESVGQPMSLQGNTVDGRKFDLSAYRGKIVLVHYWATWCEPCKQDMTLIATMLNRYPKEFVPVGVNLDNEVGTARQFITTKKVPWPQLFEEGGLESRIANEMGILSLPTMLLIDRQGRVINRNIHASEIETELKKLTK